MEQSGAEARRRGSVAPLSLSEREARLWAWDLTEVRRGVRKRLGWSPQRAKAVETEYRKFFLVALREPGTLGMAGPVDEFWHEHLLDTRDYVKFCTEIFGDYVHHIPANRGGARDGGSYRATRGLLGRYFGRVNDNVWPSPSSGGCACSNCDKSAKSSSDAPLTPQSAIVAEQREPAFIC